jgi:hypothetical protein
LAGFWPSPLTGLLCLLHLREIKKEARLLIFVVFVLAHEKLIRTLIDWVFPWYNKIKKDFKWFLTGVKYQSVLRVLCKRSKNRFGSLTLIVLTNKMSYLMTNVLLSRLCFLLSNVKYCFLGEDNSAENSCTNINFDGSLSI